MMKPICIFVLVLLTVHYKCWQYDLPLQRGQEDWHHVHCQLPQVGVELAREAEAGGDARHGQGDQ